MNYMILRDGQEYGPYTLADLQRYVTTGEVLLTDMTRSEGMTDFMPVSAVIGTIPVPAVGTHISLAPVGVEYPDPPNLHWALVLLFTVLTCGLFNAAWGLVLAVWVRKVVPGSQAMFYYIGYAACLLLIFAGSFAAGITHEKSPIVPLLQLVSFFVSLAARFKLKNSLEEHYNGAEPRGLLLSGVMTFFFGALYFQYHLNDIVRRKNLDRMDAFAR